MPTINTMIRSEIRRLARNGRLIDECFKTFQRMIYPGAPPDQVNAMRICFFAGATELFAIMNAGLDDDLSETDGDLAFMQNWVDEIERFHERTIRAMQAEDRKGAAH